MRKLSRDAILTVPVARLLSQLLIKLKAVASVPRDTIEDFSSRDKEIARNRLLLGSAVAAYTGFLPAMRELNGYLPIMISITYLVVATIAFIMTIRQSSELSFGRHLMLCIDVFALSAAFISANAQATPLLFLYIWLILGYGFRYGIYYLRLAAAESLCGLSVALLMTDFWRTQIFISSGIFMLLLIIPPYFELLLRRTVKANRSAEDANFGKAVMLAGLGHHLRVPLNGILGATKALSAGGLDLSQREALDAISTATRSLVKELDDFLDVSRLDAGRMPKEITSFSLKQLLDEIVALAGTQAYAKGLALSWYVSPSVPVNIWSERTFLSKALFNIVENAIKFTSTGSVLITVRQKPFIGKHDLLCFEVLDTGIGIRQEARAKIFESFTQADSDILHIFGGSGLGLAVAHRMLDLLGGEIGVDSEDGQGSTFWFDLPAPVSNESDTSYGGLAGVAVVIVTSRVHDLFTFANRFEKLGGKTYISNEVERWTGVIGDGLDEVDRVIVVVDGLHTNPLEVAYALRRSGALNRVPLILLTSGPGLPGPALRRQYVTSLSPDSSDSDLITAFHLAGATGGKDTDNPDLPDEARNEHVSQMPEFPMHVLVVESNRVNGHLVSKIVEKAGHTCTLVTTGDRALDALEHSMYGAVLFDVDKAEVGGIEASKLLQFQELGKRHTPIYGLTSRDDPETIARCRDAGMDGILVQPVDPEKLRSIMAELSTEEALKRGSPTSSGSVELISSHPRFRAGLGPSIEDGTFPYLLSIGGPTFVNEVVDIFKKEVTLTLKMLARATQMNDTASFHTHLSSLRESAAIVKAPRLVDLCLSGQKMKEAGIGSTGRSYVEKLQLETARVFLAIGDRSTTQMDRQDGDDVLS